MNPQTCALLFPYDNALAADTVLAEQNRPYFIPSQQSKRELDFLRDGMFPSSQEIPPAYDPLAFCYRSPCLELRPDHPPKGSYGIRGNRNTTPSLGGGGRGGERWTLGTSLECDVVLPSTQPGPSPVHAALEFSLDGNVFFRDGGFGSRVTRFGQAGEGTVLGGTWVLGPGDAGIGSQSGESLFVIEMAGARFLVVIPEIDKDKHKASSVGSCGMRNHVASLQKSPSQIVSSMLAGLSLHGSFMVCD